jgi:hypothetical protein
MPLGQQAFKSGVPKERKFEPTFRNPLKNGTTASSTNAPRMPGTAHHNIWITQRYSSKSSSIE